MGPRLRAFGDHVFAGKRLTWKSGPPPAKEVQLLRVSTGRFWIGL